MTIRASLSTPRAAIMAVFAAFGLAVGLFSGSIPALMRQTGLSAYDFGIGLAISTFATAIAMALVGPAARRLSNRAALLALLPLIGLSVFAVMASASMWPFFIASFVFGAAMGATDLFMNAEGGAIEHDLKRPVFTAFHGAVSLAVALSAVPGSLIANAWGPAAAAWPALTALAASWFMVWWCVPARPIPRREAADRGALPHRGLLLILGLISGLCVSCEIAAIQWSAKLLDDLAPRLAAIAGLGVAFYALCNALVRAAGDRIRARFGDFLTMRTSILVAAAGFAGLGLSRNFAEAVAAFAIIGFGAALFTPCTFAAIARLAGDARARALSFSSLVASPPRIVSPFAFGALASVTSATYAFAACGLVLAVALALTLLIDRERVNA